MIRFDVVTLFPEMFAAVTHSGISGRALETGLWSLGLWNPRDFTRDNYRTVDDRPYGGGPGMLMLAEPLEKALDAAKEAGGGKVIYLSPQGRKLDHEKVMELAGRKAVTLLCGRYEGVDERLIRRRVDEELSIGRLRALRRRAGGDGGDRRGGAPDSRRARRRAVGGRGVLRAGAARLPAVHAPGGRTRARRCRRFCCPGTTRTSGAGG